MTDSSSSKEINAPRTLNAQDTKLFEHWKQIFSSLHHSPANKSSQTSSPRFNLNSTAEPSLQKDLSTDNAVSATDLTGTIDPVTSERQHTGCINLVNKLFEKSPIIIFMNSELQKIGCSPPVYCAPCPQKVHGGFSQEMGIIMCENNNYTSRRMESTLAHEMVHAFDHCRFKFDHGNLKHVACAEVRAVALSRECRFLDEAQHHLLARWHGVEDTFGFNRRMQECVKRRAITSLMCHESKPTREVAERLINQVFPSCFRDTRPFDEIY